MQTIITYYKNLTRWDIKSYLSIFLSPYPIEELGKYIYEHSEKENIGKEAKKEFPILGVTNKVGVYLNEYVKGENIHQPYKKVKNGELTYNPYRVNIGSIGIVQKEYSNFYISPAYVVFGTKKELLNEYIYLVLSSNWFNPYLRAATSGSVRQNLTFDLLSQLKVPVPPLKIQENIVRDWHKAQKEAQELNKKADEKEKSVDDYILQELGIEKKEYKKKKSASIIWFRDLDKWSLQYLLFKKEFSKNKYPVLNLNSNDNLYSLLTRGKSPKYQNETNAYVLNQKCNRWNNIEVEYAKSVNDTWLSSINKNLKTKVGDIIINSTGEGTIGRSSVIKNGFEGWFFDSHILLLRLEQSKINSEYYVNIFNSSYIQKQIEISKSAQSTQQTELGIENVKNLQIPFPPLKTQKEIVAKVERIRKEIYEIRNQANKILEITKNKAGDILKI